VEKRGLKNCDDHNYHGNIMGNDDVTLRKCGFIFLGIEWNMNGKYPLAMTNNLRSGKITIKRKVYKSLK
jgi:hypothetical protein